ncbi:MAG TPA: pyrroloquinoline quinone biosynthesis protein PqqB [Nevskiaceae bacterium]|nr:pyrroloquinoline quinone biosynthesis protein PqqB [Nevskiaceae bacterium]
MRIMVLGAAAGGGFPQWNSNGAGCRRARAGDPAAPARTQASIAVTADDTHWFLFNASPDLRQQINATPALQPRGGLRDTPIAGAVLTGGDVDAITGLLTMRERQPFTVYATRAVMGILNTNSIFEVLARDVVKRHTVALESTTELCTPDGAPTGLSCKLFAVPGKVPLYLESRTEAPAITVGEDITGAEISANGHRLLFIPGCAEITGAVKQRVRGAELLLFDGTLWQDDEMITLGAGTKTGHRMGHMSLSGPHGTIAALAELGIRRKVFIHINNSNPVLVADTPQRRQTEAAGWEVSYDGMEIKL